MAEGPLRGYRSEDQTLSVVRGRIRVREQELRRFGQVLPLEVTVDEWTVDTDENRRLRAATRRLLVLPGLAYLTRTRLRRLDRQLAGVTTLPTAAVLTRSTPTRLNARLHDLLALADLVLAAESVEHRVGDVRVSGFVLSMPLLFERLLTRLLVETTRGSSLVVVGQRSVPLDTRGDVTIKPDLTVLRRAAVVAVADVKYKLLDEHGRFPNADAYQLVTYCSRLGLSTGHLIYAGGEPAPNPLHVLGTEVRLVTHAVNLACSLKEIITQVAEVAVALRSPAA